MLRRVWATPGPGCGLPFGPASSSFLQEIPTEPHLGKPLSRSTIPGVVSTLLSTPAVIPVCWVTSAAEWNAVVTDAVHCARLRWMLWALAFHTL